MSKSPTAEGRIISNDIDSILPIVND